MLILNQYLNELNSAASKNLVYLLLVEPSDSEYYARQLLVTVGKIAIDAEAFLKSINDNYANGVVSSGSKYYQSLGNLTQRSEEYFSAYIVQTNVEENLIFKAKYILDQIKELKKIQKTSSIADVQKQYKILVEIYNKTNEFIK